MLSAILAHAGEGSGNTTAFTIMLVTVLVVIWALLGAVCWIFWRAKKRDDEQKEQQKEKELEWRNAPSS
jgi:heme/copper-type cytochrome/quinol oxidase subunit 2